MKTNFSHFFQFVVLSVLVASAIAGYGNYGNSYGSYLSYGRAPIQAAIQSRRSLSIVDVPSTYSLPTPLNIDVPASTSPLNVLLRSASSPLNVQTLHEGSAGSYASSSSVDAPHIRSHTVLRPIQQQVTEIVQPQRFIKQEVHYSFPFVSLICKLTFSFFLLTGTPNRGTHWAGCRPRLSAAPVAEVCLRSSSTGSVAAGTSAEVWLWLLKRNQFTKQSFGTFHIPLLT